MANEITQPEIGVKDGQINFKNVEQFKSDFEQIISRNSNFVVTDETLSGSKKARSELRNAAKESAAWRSKVKAQLLKPFEEVSEIAVSFEKKAKAAADEIDTDVKVFDEAEKQKRRDGLNEYIAQRSSELDVEPDIEINDKWFIKGNFNGTKPKQTFIEEHIEPQLNHLVELKQQRVADTIAVRNYAESKEFDPEGYIHSLDFKSLAQIMADIDGDVIKRQKREEAEKAIAEMQAKQEQQKAVTQVGEKTVTEDGEIVETVKPVEPEQPKTYTRKLVVTGTLKQLQLVADFMRNNGIKFGGE
ncbi:DUF1351 domain-containing protein [Leuconostoc falkenbergense]|uniref:DUF1351 domain-containing protein n=1 Tax=Leuconostoc falkenbergense TaxID=2766470 RepID=UPI0021AACCD1|nr:DUF1351 domain-containing protein [Leuconostoc falkenbergense]MCT4377662.1 DUF1351 domain-containing protein [Leuconostoc falkenbergense]